jgi:hypothetical protein
VIDGLEDSEDYRGFEAAVIADYDAETAVERELVLRLASLLWRLRRIIAIETDLFAIQAEILRDRRNAVATVHGELADRAPEVLMPTEGDHLRCSRPALSPRELTYCFLRARPPPLRSDCFAFPPDFPVAEGPPFICRVIFDKMQGGRPISLLESHCAVESWKNFSLSKEQGEAKRDCREKWGTAGFAKKEADPGITERTVTEERSPPRSLGDAKPDSGKTPTGPAHALGGRMPFWPLSSATGWRRLAAPGPRRALVPREACIGLLLPASAGGGKAAADPGGEKYPAIGGWLFSRRWSVAVPTPATFNPPVVNPNAGIHGTHGQPEDRGPGPRSFGATRNRTPAKLQRSAQALGAHPARPLSPAMGWRRASPRRAAKGITLRGLVASHNRPPRLTAGCRDSLSCASSRSR